MRARETWSEIVFSLLVAKTRISQCFFDFDGQAAAHNFSCRSNDSAKQSGCFEAYHHGGRDNRAQETHTADTCQCADQKKSCITTIHNIRRAAVLFFQLRPFLPFGFEMLTNPRDLLKAVGLVRGRALAQQFWI